MHGRSGLTRLRLLGSPRPPVIATALRSYPLGTGDGAWLRSCSWRATLAPVGSGAPFALFPP
eukprot:2840237-Lingulodinium_polyedra.AAC.1